MLHYMVWSFQAFSEVEGDIWSCSNSFLISESAFLYDNLCFSEIAFKVYFNLFSEWKQMILLFKLELSFVAKKITLYFTTFLCVSLSMEVILAGHQGWPFTFAKTKSPSDNSFSFFLALLSIDIFLFLFLLLINLIRRWTLNYMLETLTDSS